MALSYTAVKRVACQNCRQSVLRSFIASIGGPTQQTPDPWILPRRSFASSSRWHNTDAPTQHRRTDDAAINSTPPSKQQDLQDIPKPEDSTEQPTQQTPHVPWYLQAAQPDFPAPEHPLSARQQLPDLPEHPPAILQPLLEHVSVDLGMDDLSLLDLRSLDPPSALGANLLMIIGSARSDKHLHVSADRLCRWLRSTHRLAPYADGLLGRNELKLKLRRRAKRSRLLSAVGAKSTANTELDEGIRTGWVCVNVGKVEGGELPKTQEEAERERGVVGFGTQVGGSSVVVQLMTEEKRQEIDLEKLWATVMRMSKREREADPAREEAAVGAGAGVSESVHAFSASYDNANGGVEIRQARA